MTQSGGRRPGRIPADQISAVTSWQMPKIQSSRVIKVTASKSRGRGRVSGPDFAHDPVAAATGMTPKPKGTGQAEAPARVPTPTSQGYQHGYARGQAEGQAQGETAGFAKGQAAGFAQGEAEGYKAAAVAYAKEVETQQQSLTGLLAALQAPVQDVRDAMQAQLVPLVTGIVEAVLLSELRTHPEHVQNLVSAGLDAMPHGASTVQVAVHPDRVAMVAGLVAELDTPVEVIADPALVAGGCRIHSSHTQLDSSLSKNLRRCLQQVFEGEAAKLDQITETNLKLTEQSLFDTSEDMTPQKDSTT